MSTGSHDPASPSPPVGFATTHWSAVLLAGGGDSADAQAALSDLCRTYWYPLYAYVRRRGYSEADAQDLVQGFFVQLLRRQSLRRVVPDRARFRSYLLGALHYFLLDQREFAQAEKRGSKCEFVSWDADSAESRYRLESAQTRTPEQLYERQWALTLLESVLGRLEQEYTAAGKRELLARLQDSLLGDKAQGNYARIGADLSMTEGAVKMAALRLRHRYRELIYQAIADTVADPSEIERELLWLLSAVSR